MNPLHFYFKAIQAEAVDNVFDLYSIRTQELPVWRTVEDGLYCIETKDLLDVVAPEKKSIGPKELMKILLGSEERAVGVRVEKQLSEKNKQDKQDFLIDIINRIDNYLGLFTTKYKGKKALEPLKKSLQTVRQNLLTHYDHLLPKGLRTAAKTGKTNHDAKVVWTGGVAMLATLFHDLKALQLPNKESSFITNEWQELASWIYHNFLDENGDVFPEDSLRTYLDPNPKKKKAKRNRIKVELE